MKPRSAFTLIELLVSIAVIGVLAALLLSGLSRLRAVAQSAHCANSLRQLGVATQLYLADNDRKFFAYSRNITGGKLWYFGFESTGSAGAGEGKREVDVTRSPLFPYIGRVGGVEICPAFPYGMSIWKPKFRGASWGYGFNSALSNVTATNLATPSQVILFGDCGQVNTFQPPASPTKPLLEEFYMIDRYSRTIHFRHGNHANIMFVDGHIERRTPYPGTLDTRLPEANCGRITPAGSNELLF